MAEIEFQEVTKRFPDGTEAVKSLELSIADGEFMILVGPSGCGKSTALRMIAGLESVSEGKMVIDGAVVNDLPPRHRDVAMVFQSYALYPHMTVAQNMGFALKMAKVPANETAERVRNAANTLDLVPYLQRKPAQLSGGQRQRVAMGRAIVRSPRAFLMDEPLSNLDAKLRVQMRAEIAQMQARLNATTIYVTHDQVEAMTLGDRVAVLRDGHMQQVDTPRRLYEQPANLFVAGFIGSPAMNLIPARLEEDSIQLPFCSLPLPDRLRSHMAPIRDREVIVGLRPEHLEDAAMAFDRAGPQFRAKVVAVESMGSETYVYFDAGVAGTESVSGSSERADDGRPEVQTRHLIARVHASTQARPGETTEFIVDAAEVQVFDAASGANLQIT